MTIEVFPPVFGFVFCEYALLELERSLSRVFYCAVLIAKPEPPPLAFGRVLTFITKSPVGLHCRGGGMSMGELTRPVGLPEASRRRRQSQGSSPATFLMHPSAALCSHLGLSGWSFLTCGLPLGSASAYRSAHVHTFPGRPSPRPGLHRVRHTGGVQTGFHSQDTIWSCWFGV